MEQKEFTIKSLDYTFRPKRMNAIEVLSLRTMMDNRSIEKVMTMYTAVLERIEVKIADSWQPVKMSGREVYLPAEIEDNAVAVEELCNYMIKNVIVEVFTKSDVSSKRTK